MEISIFPWVIKRHRVLTSILIHWHFLLLWKSLNICTFFTFLLLSWDPPDILQDLEIAGLLRGLTCFYSTKVFSTDSLWLSNGWVRVVILIIFPIFIELQDEHLNPLVHSNLMPSGLKLKNMSWCLKRVWRKFDPGCLSSMDIQFINNLKMVIFDNGLTWWVEESTGL